MPVWPEQPRICDRSLRALTKPHRVIARGCQSAKRARGMKLTDEHDYKDPVQPATMEAMESRQLLAGWGPAPALVDLDLAHSRYKSVDGRGHTVAIIDTGVDYKHPALGGAWGKVVVGGYDFVDNDSDPMDESGHGTAVAGVIAARQFFYKSR